MWPRECGYKMPVWFPLFLCWLKSIVQRLKAVTQLLNQTSADRVTVTSRKDGIFKGSVDLVVSRL